jgi:16S rRNA (cytosine1402-N4)-methyltransferase
MAKRLNENVLNTYHQPVMVNEVLDAFGLSHIAPLNLGKISDEMFTGMYVDATLGTAGHTLALLERGVNVLAIDTDLTVLKIAEERLKSACPVPNSFQGWGPYKLHRGNFRDIDEIVGRYEINKVNGILADLGISTLHLRSDRGFSFGDGKAVLDMRLDPQAQGVTAYDLLNALSKKQLIELFVNFMRVDETRKLANAIVEYRNKSRFHRVSDFVDVIEKSIKGRRNIDKSTVPFMALRAYVNDELGSLEHFLNKSFGMLSEGGVLAVITFHSTEDRIVKNFINNVKNANKHQVETEMVQVSKEEARNNPRSRSAKLRVLKNLNFK